jgi:predicted transcriptional regulator
LHCVFKEISEENSVLLQNNSILGIVTKRQFLKTIEMRKKKCAQKNEAT